MSNKKINELFNLAGQTVIITGGSMGIGYGIVKRLAEAGANIVIADIDEIGKTKAQTISQEHDVKAIFIKTDVSSEESVKNLIAQAEKQFGKIDIFVNNAGIFPMSPTLETSLELWEKVQAINLRGVFLCCREAAKSMIKNGGGNIINIASVDALNPSMAELAAYDASKHGVWGFTKSFALEMAKEKIRINAIAPGGIRTEGVEKMTSGQTKVAEHPGAPKEAPLDVPMKRMGEPNEIATVALFLASDASSYMTGSIVVADGGMLLG